MSFGPSFGAPVGWPVVNLPAKPASDPRAFDKLTPLSPSNSTDIPRPAITTAKGKPAKQPITAIPAYKPTVPRQIKSKQTGRSNLPSPRFNTVFDALTPMTALAPLDQVYMKREDGSGRVGSMGSAKKRKYAYENEGFCGERIALAEKGCFGMAKNANEWLITPAPCETGGSFFKPIGRAFEICMDEDKQKRSTPEPTPLLPSLDLPSRSPTKHTHSKLHKRSRKEDSDTCPSLASPNSTNDSSPGTPPPVSSSTGMRATQREIRSLSRENKELKNDLREAQDSALKYSRRAGRLGKEADRAEKDNRLAQAAAAAKEVEVAELKTSLQARQREVEKAQRAAGDWEKLARAEQATSKLWEKEVGQQKAIAQQANHRLPTQSPAYKLLELQLADTTMQLHALQAAFQALPPVQSTFMPTPFDFAALRQALLVAKTETANERNTSQQLQKEVNRFISAQAVWREEKAKLQEDKRKADEAREASLVSSGNKMALLNDEHEQQFAEMEAQMEVLEELKRQLDETDGVMVEYAATCEALQQELAQTKEDLKLQRHRGEWYKKELAASQSQHSAFIVELDEARMRVEDLAKQLETAQAQTSAQDMITPAPPLGRAPTITPTGPKVPVRLGRAVSQNTPVQSRVPLLDQLNAAHSRMRALEKLVHDKTAELDHLRRTLHSVTLTNRDLEQRCQVAESRAYRAEKEVDYARYREAQQARPSAVRGYGELGRAYRPRGYRPGGVPSVPTGPAGRRKSLADRISRIPPASPANHQPDHAAARGSVEVVISPPAVKAEDGATGTAKEVTATPTQSETSQPAHLDIRATAAPASTVEHDLEDGEIAPQTDYTPWSNEPISERHRQCSATSDTPSLSAGASSRSSSNDSAQSQELFPTAGTDEVGMPYDGPQSVVPADVQTDPRDMGWAARAALWNNQVGGRDK